MGRERPDQSGVIPVVLAACPAVESSAVAKALASLHPDHRRVLVETYFCGSSVAEAAATLGIPASTVKSRALHALKALKRALQDQGLAP